MLNFIKTFRSDEDGAVTVDWVVLTAAVVGLGIAVIAAIGDNLGTATGTIETRLGTAGAANTEIGDR